MAKSESGEFTSKINEPSEFCSSVHRLMVWQIFPAENAASNQSPATNAASKKRERDAPDWERVFANSWGQFFLNICSAIPVWPPQFRGPAIPVVGFAMLMMPNSN